MIAIMWSAIEAHLNGLRARQQHFESGQFLFHRGDRVEQIYLVRSGSVHLVRHQNDGSVLILQRAAPGSILAEASLYSEKYHCDAVAFGPVETRTFTKASVKKLLANNPRFADGWARFLAHELQEARLRSEILALKTVAARLDAWMEWRGAGLPAKGEWKLVANEISVSPEALYREIANRRMG